jgi:Saf4/Yju2 protein
MVELPALAQGKGFESFSTPLPLHCERRPPSSPHPLHSSVTMSERKVLSKYYPPDFDPSKLTRRRGGKKGPRQQTVRLMTPFSMRCNTCGEYIYRGKKFNARKEDAQESYLTIKIFRFYIRCTRCNAEITFKTDPKNNDYSAERGASRNFEPWREEKPEETEEERLERLEQEMNPMKDLEIKQMDSKREMELMDALDQVRASNARIDKAARNLDPEEILKLVRQEEDEKETEAQRLAREDAEAAKRAFEGANGETVRRIRDETDKVADDIAPAGLLQGRVPHVFAKPIARKRKESVMSTLGIIKKKTKFI